MQTQTVTVTLTEVETRLRNLAETKERVANHKHALKSQIDNKLTDMGYLPPEPSPFLSNRIFHLVASEVLALNKRDSDLPEAISAIRTQQNEKGFRLALDFLIQIEKNLQPPPWPLRWLKRLWTGANANLDRATVSYSLPSVDATVLAQIEANELFLAKEWSQGSGRGVLAIHVDQAKDVTVIQIGIAVHGPIYITIPGILDPEAVAHATIRVLFNRMPNFRDAMDPVAVIDGSFQRLNYNTIFTKNRVIRAPSGNTDRLLRNIRETAKRDRLSSENTVIFNSVPVDKYEYVSVFGQDDPTGQRWERWDGEARLWNDMVASARFGLAPQASRQAVLEALSTAKNVIVIVAHCDGRELFMPAPPPKGTVITVKDLIENREAIAANAPFVYLFSCRAGLINDLKDFASILLECGAAGVVASQEELGSADARTMLGRVLDERRGEPPVEDFYKAMDDVRYREMEVFLG